MNGAVFIRGGLLAAAVVFATGCGGDNNPAPSNGNATLTGGAVATGGSSNPSTGGSGTAPASTSVGGATIGSGGGLSTGGSNPSTGGGSTAGGASTTGGKSAASGGSTPGGASGVTGGSTPGGASGTGGSSTAGTTSAGGTSSTPFVYFAKQANGTTTGTMANGTISVSATYGSSGNAFKVAAPNYYGTASNGFIAYPTAMEGDFSITAQVTVTAQNKNNNASGIGLGIATGFAPTDAYAYVIMRNASSSTTAGSTNTFYVSGAGAISNSSGPTISWSNNSAVQLSLSRTGTTVSFGAGTVGSPPTTQTLNTSVLTDGTSTYGSGPVYPAISFNNVTATIEKLIVKDATGTTLYDSDTGSLVNYVPAALTVSASSASIKKGGSTTLVATATAIGGAVSPVTVVADDPTIVDASVTTNATNSTVTLNGLKGGTATVTITNSADANPATNSKQVVVSVNDYEATDDYGPLTTVAYPVPGATNAYADGELALTFDSAPALNVGGSVKIFKLSDGTEVDSVSFTNEALTFGTAASPTTINVGAQLVRVSGNTVYVSPHVGKLAYATGYYVAIPTTSITATLNGKPFNGLSDRNSVATWSFTTRAAPTLDPVGITVDGSQASTANFRTIQAALNAAQSSMVAETNVNIRVAAGTYNELLRYVGPGAAQTVTISGPTGNVRGDSCVVQWANGNGMNGSTATRASFYFNAANLVLENITLKNSALRSAVAQAETLYFAGGLAGTTLAAFNSSFVSNQDTLQTTGRNWFYNCSIEGNVDFIWGSADAALFEDCSMHFVNDTPGTTASYSLVVARTGATIAATSNGTVGKGYVVLNSTVNVDANVTAYFGRNAGNTGFYDQVALINTTFTGSGSVGAGLWNVQTAPLAIGDSSFVGWKSVGCTGLNLASLTTAAATSSVIASQDTEYDTRDHILNRIVTVASGAPTGYQGVTSPWDVSALAATWNAP